MLLRLLRQALPANGACLDMPLIFRRLARFYCGSDAFGTEHELWRLRRTAYGSHTSLASLPPLTSRDGQPLPRR
ncbi:hypothetical protein BCEN4_660048 [Burkholderia cenocepacia]|nr:hypothetical protein BCEN4_660048 [Burkholderia cenocepacia]